MVGRQTREMTALIVRYINLSSFTISSTHKEIRQCSPTQPRLQHNPFADNIMGYQWLHCKPLSPNVHKCTASSVTQTMRPLNSQYISPTKRAYNANVVSYWIFCTKGIANYNEIVKFNYGYNCIIHNHNLCTVSLIELGINVLNQCAGTSNDIEDALGYLRPSNASGKWAIFPWRMLSRNFSPTLRMYPCSNGNAYVFIDSMFINAIIYTPQSCPLKLKSCNCKIEARESSIRKQLIYRLLVLLGAASVFNFPGYALCIWRWMHQRKANCKFLHHINERVKSQELDNFALAYIAPHCRQRICTLIALCSRGSILSLWM